VRLANTPNGIRDSTVPETDARADENEITHRLTNEVMKFARPLSLHLFSFSARSTIHPEWTKMTATGLAAAAAENSCFDRLSPWNERWSENKIGWHDSNVNDAILSYGHRWIPRWGQQSSSTSDCAATATTSPSSAAAVRVFVPLCGKAVDMAHLARQTDAIAQVVGVEGITKAIEEFAQEQPDLELTKEEEPHGTTTYPAGYTRYVGNNIMILEGDFFQLDEKITDGRFQAIFDRGSLVAIDPNLRRAYVNVMSKLIAPQGRILLVAVERQSGTDDDLTGPPFSVSEAEVHRLYGTQPWVESINLLDDNGEKERNQGTTRRSLFFLIQAK